MDHLEMLLGSKLKLKQDKKTYQMDFRNSSEVFREVGFDIRRVLI